MHLLSISHLSISQRCPKGSGGISLSPAPLVVVLEVKSEPLLCYVVRVWTTWKILGKNPRANQGRITNEITMWEYGTNTFLFILQPGYDIVFPSITEWTYLLILLNLIYTYLNLNSLHVGILYRGGFIGGCTGCAPLLALDNRGAMGVQKIKFRNTAQFPRFFLFWSQTEAHNSMPISQEMAFLGF